jgi:NADH-quinone oxidoreductase subunit I
VSQYFRNIYATVYTILVGMRITLRYFFARTVTLQYPDLPPTNQPRYRGFHFYEIEKCIACDMCAKACPVDCIYIEKTGPRKLDKASGVAKGGAMLRYAIDYAKCMFCGLCTDPCPTDCIHMGDNHDLSAYDRASLVVEFTELAKEGLQTPQPLWMTLKTNLPEWAQQRRQQWEQRAAGLQQKMIDALSESEIPKPKKKPKPEGDAKPKPAAAAANPAAKTEAPAKPAAEAKPDPAAGKDAPAEDAKDK